MSTSKILNALLWGGAFMTVGVIWLMSNIGVISFEIWKLWPLIFVIIGVSIIIDGFEKK